MWRITALAVILCAGFANGCCCECCGEGCGLLWRDSFLGDLARGIHWNGCHKNSNSDGSCAEPAPAADTQPAGTPSQPAGTTGQASETTNTKS
jgi:hypothetical protein